MVRLSAAGGLLVAWSLLPGCAVPSRRPAPLEQFAAAAARPILALDPNANWTECFNTLVDLGPVSLAYLMKQPAMTRRAAPDDLAVLMHTSLLRLLISGSDAPTLSTTTLETTLGILHFDLKVGGERIGTLVMAEPAPPRAWHDLYPADFNHDRAAAVDVEADRATLRAWWARHAQSDVIPMARPLRPRPVHLWRLLGRRYADGWLYQPEPQAMLCGGPSRDPVPLRLVTYDYNLVRAVCIWLGSHPDREVQDRLIGLVASRSRTIAHNARFALRCARDERIRAAVERYDNRDEGHDQSRKSSAAL